jgi:hypothetical protein
VRDSEVVRSDVRRVFGAEAIPAVDHREVGGGQRG